MKPYVVILKQIKDNKIILTEEELKAIVERAYDDGYNDGNSYYWRHYWSNYPYIYNTTCDNITYTHNLNTLNDLNTNSSSNLNITFKTGE